MSSGSNKVPWSRLTNGVGSTAAPGPPHVFGSHNVNERRRDKMPKKLEKKLKNFESPPTTTSSEASDCDASSPKEESHEQDVQKWNPMEEDYASPSFNSYNSGPGKLLKPQGSTSNTYTLFADKIPVALTRDGLSNLFSRCGKVKRSSVVKNNNSVTTFGFVEFGTVKEADAALQQMNNFDMGDGIRLSVKVSERQIDRKRRMEEKRENECFFSSLNMSKNKNTNNDNSSEYESYEMNEDDEECQNPFNPTFNPCSPAEPQPETTTNKSPQLPKPSRMSPMGRGLSRRFKARLSDASPGKVFDSNSSPTSKAGFNSPRSLPCSSVNTTNNVSSSPQQEEGTFSSLPSSLNSSTDNSNSTSSDQQLMTPQDFTSFRDSLNSSSDLTAVKHLLPNIGDRSTTLPNPSEAVTGRTVCTYCGQPSGKKCAVCRTPYCSLECQKKDWSRHKLDCKRLSLNSSNEHDTSSSQKSEKHPEKTQNTDDPYEELEDLCQLMNSVNVELPSIMKEGQSLLQPPPDSPMLSAVSQSPPTTITRNSVVTDSSTVPPNPLTMVNSSPAAQNNLGPSANEARLPRQIDVSYSDLLDAFSRIPSSTYLPMIDIRAKTMLPAFVGYPTVIISSHQFSLFPLNERSKADLFKLLEFEKKNLHTVQPVSDLPDTMRLFGYKCGDGLFQRIEVNSSTKLIKSYDTGELLGSLQLQRLFVLPDELTSLSTLRCKMSLVDLEQPSVKAIAVEGRKFLHDKIWGKVIKVKQSLVMQQASLFLVGTVFSMDESINYNKLLLETGYVVQRPGKKTPSTSLNAGDKHLQQQRPQVINSQSSRVAFHVPPMHEHFEIYPTAVSSPGLIWGQVFHEHSSYLENLLQDLNTAYEGKINTNYVPSRGELCAARFSDDDLYYRAEVICVNNNGLIDVQFVDYGNKETVSFSDIYKLQPCFYDLPKQALCFALAGIDPITAAWSSEACSFLRQAILQEQVRVKIVSEVLNKYFVTVNLLDSPDVSINEVMVEKGFAKRSGSMKGISGRPVVSPKIGRGSAFNHPLKSPRGGEGQEEDKPGRSSFERKSHLSPGSPNVGGSGTNRAKWQQFNRNEQNGSLQALNECKSNTFKQRLAEVEREGKPHWTSSSEQDGGRKSYQANRKKEFAPEKAENTSQKGEGRFDNKESPTSSLIGHIIVKTSPFGSKNEKPVSINDNKSVSIPIQTLPQNSKTSAVVVHVENPELFYVMSLNNAQELVRLSEELQATSRQPVSNVEIGDFCLTKYTDDDCYGRVKVLRLKPNKALLRFIDYGNKQPVFVKDLCVIAPEHCALPQQAIPCILEGVAPPSSTWSREAIQYFIGLILNKQVQVEPVCIKEENIHVVKLVLDSNLDVAVALAEHNYAQLSGVQQPRPVITVDENPTMPPSSPIVMCDSLRHISLAQEASVVLSDVTSPSEFYVHTADQETKENISKVIVPPSDFVCQPLTRPLPVGSLCCAKFAEDGNWYRVRVSSSDGDGDYFVHFIDFGNYATVSRLDISLCPEKLTLIPVLAVQCALNGLQPVMQWSSSAIEAFKLMASGKMLQAFVAAKPSPSEKAWRVTLTDSSGDVDIGSHLVSQGLATSTIQTAQANPLSSLSSPLVLPAPVPSFPPAIILPPQLPKPKEKVKMLMTHINSPSNFYAEILTEETLQSFFQGLCKELPHAYSDSSKYAGFKASVGAYCCAKFSQDGCWYRCQVKEVSADSAVLFYVDYGNTDTAPLTDLYHLDPVFASLPAQAVCFSLDGVHPSSGSEWSHMSVDYLKSIGGNPLYAVVCSVGENGVVNVNLFSDEEFSQSMAHMLVDCGLAVADTVMFSIPAFTLPNSAGGMINVVVSDVTSFSSLYIQVAVPEVQRTLSDLQSALPTYAKSCPVSSNYRLKVNDFCCAVFYDDGCWYRAQVTSLSGNNKVKVVYVDFGNSGTVQLSDVRPLTKELAKYPRVACHVTLANLASLPSSVLSSFKALTDGKILGMKVTNVNVTPCEVELYDPESEHSLSINQQVLDIASSISICIQEKLSSKPSVSIDPPHLPQKNEFSVMVVHAESLDKLFVQVTEADNIQNLMKLMENINAFCQTAPPLSAPPTVGQLCLAQFSGDYFRGKVLEVSGDRGRVLFIDFGNIDIVHFSNMKSIPSHLSTLPAQALKCSLVGTPSSGTVSPAAIETFTSLVANTEVKCKVVNRHPLIVDLQKNDISPSVRQMLCKDDCLPVMSDPSLLILDQVVIPESCKVLVMITEVEKPSIFWLQLFDETVLTDFQKVTVDLKMHCEHSQPMTKGQLLLGQLCCAKFEQDGCWYRARVVDFAVNQDAIVQFVDFGNIQSTPALSLRGIPQRLLKLPAQGVPCIVSGCSLDCERTREVSSLTLNKQFHCLKKGVSPDGFPLVDLFDVATGASLIQSM